MLGRRGNLHSGPLIRNLGRHGTYGTEWMGIDEELNGDREEYSDSASGLSFSSTMYAFRKWDAEVGCAAFRGMHHADVAPVNRSVFLQDPNPVVCSDLKQKHVSVLVKAHSWIPDNLNNLYSCGCGLSCLWEKSAVLVDEPDAHFYELYKPPYMRQDGEPLRVYMDLEAAKRRSRQDIFVSYHHKDTLQVTYAGNGFHTNRNHHISAKKNPDILVYWSSSRCVRDRQQIAKGFLSLVPHHSFGKCLNNVGGRRDALDKMYPGCSNEGGGESSWTTNLHCGMSHYKFVLAIENTFRDSYVTEKLFYALDAGSVPIYFGAPNVLELVPPNSIILGSSFESMEQLALYVKQLADNPVEYAEYHAWRRCGVLGNYVHTRAVSLDSLPCRLCAIVSRMGGKNASSSGS
ncbi:unnamed protein product [Calypogeia fissa]